MTSFNTVMDVYKHLEKTNCRKCNEKTCLAFAAAVFQGRKPLDACPYVAPELTEKATAGSPDPPAHDREQAQQITALKEQVSMLDFETAAGRTGATLSKGKLILNSLGKAIGIDSHGNLSADIHLHAWLSIPVLRYVLHCKGTPLSGRWVSYRELKTQGGRYPLFRQRCEQSLKKIADRLPRFFETMIQLFNGQPVGRHFDADISLVLHPLPRIPMLFCYWKPEEGIESKLSIFFDDSADDNMDAQALYMLSAGLVVMFEKIAHRHGSP